MRLRSLIFALVAAAAVAGTASCGPSASDGATTGSPPAPSGTKTPSPSQTASPSRTPTAPASLQSDTAISLRTQDAIRALGIAAEKVPDGRPYDLETERYGDKEVWRIKVASGRDRPYEFYISSDGRRVLRRGRHEFDDDAAKALRAKVTLRDALRTAAKRVDWRLSETEIDRHRNALVWEVEFTKGGREREVTVSATNGKIVRVKTEDD